MKHKLMSGIAAIVVGIILISLAVHWMHKIEEAQGFVTDFKNFFAHNTMWNPLITFFGGSAEEELSKYDTETLICYYSGIILCIGGGLTVAYALYKKYRRRS